MKHIIITLLLFVIYACKSYAQRPKNGTYTYQVAFAEYQGRSLGATVLVKIKGDSIYVIHNGNNLSGKKGEVIDCGIIMQHRKTGEWIIGHHSSDKLAPYVGGCSDGPRVIDFVHKKFWLC
ncbi:hypothetical protein [Chitinophaga filiformis]|uniref:Uncharacterized protein n=1 Tax=Chitinophaga filiformis TaxID=104663 RepID=A0ABY4HV01_CHIFI|nr:hypothetical protein [Chitinophaga filiformis]UPK67427.1 hypothetical protein MYF79_21015 [Chitinophaga filiformis]